MADELREWKPRNRLANALAGGLKSVNAFAAKPFGYENPPGEMLVNALALPQIANTLERYSYGQPITNAGKANVPMLPSDTADALMAAAPVVAKWPRQAAGAAGLMASMTDAGANKALFGGLKRGDMRADYLKGLISSQRYIDRDRVAQKIINRDFDVTVTPEFLINGEPVRAIQDGHHSLEAAIRSGHKPRFIVNTASENDRIGLLEDGRIDDFLEAAYHDSPWYDYVTKRELF